MKVMLIESPLANLEGPGLNIAWCTGCLRAAGHEVVQWNAGAALVDHLVSSSNLRQAAQIAQQAVDKLSQEPELDKIQGAGLLSLLDNLPLAPMLVEHIDAFKAGLRRGGATPPLSAVPYDPVQAALDICTSPHFPERITNAERLRYNNLSYLSPWSSRSAADLVAAARTRDTFWDAPLREVAIPHVKAQNPALIALITNGPNQIVPAFKFAALLRETMPAVRVALAGNWGSAALKDASNPQLFDFFHFIITGSAEDVLPDLCAHLDGVTAVENVLGIIYRDQAGTVKSTDQTPAVRFSERPAPDFSGYNFEHLFTDPSRLQLPFQITTGCPAGNCVFCMTDTPRLGAFAALPAATAVSHLRSVMAATGCASFQLADPSLPARQAEQFARELLDTGTVITWHATVRADAGFTFEVCEIMRASGCMSLDVGLEALDDKTLIRLGKGLRVSALEQSVRNMAANGLVVNAHMLFGVPGVSSAEFDASVSRLLDWIRDGLVHHVRWNTFLLMKNTEMARNAETYSMTIRNPDRLDASEMLLYDRIGGMTDQELAQAWQDVNTRTAQALARARTRPVRPQVPQPAPGDSRFLALRPMVIPHIQVQHPAFSYQDLRKCSPIQWNPAQLSFKQFQDAAATGPRVTRLQTPRSLVKNPLANTHFELSADYERILQEVKIGGTVGDIIARIEASGPAAGEPNTFEDIFRRLVQLRSYILVFPQD